MAEERREAAGRAGAGPTPAGGSREGAPRGDGQEAATGTGEAPEAGLAPARPVGPASRRFSDDEVARILRTAAELQERSAVATRAGGGGALSLEDLRQVAAEVGIEPRFVEMAADRLHHPVEGEESPLAGAPYAWTLHRTVPGEVREEDRDWIVRAIRGVLGQKGEVEDVYGRMEWSFDDGLGPIMVGLSSRDGVTEIDVSARRGGEVGMIHGLGVPFGGLAGGGLIGGLLLGMSGPMILLPMAAMSVVSYGGARWLWKRTGPRWEAKLERLADTVAAAAAEVAVATDQGQGPVERLPLREGE